MFFAIWTLIIGALLITMALSSTLLKRLPLSTAMLYLAVGYGLGPAGLALMAPDPLIYTVLLERMAEVAVLISLFAVGLKLGLPLSNRGWRLPVRLATVSMTLTVALIAAIGVIDLGLSLGAAILLGAILAPTDPVLASDVQVEEAKDRDQLRFSLTGEGALNDGAAFPFVMLGLGLLGLHDLGTEGWRWFAVDVFWAIAGGLGIGGALGTLIGRLVVYLRSRHKESVGFDEFLALGLIALTYGFAVLSHTYGFLAVFAAGLALQRVKEQPEEVSHSTNRETDLQSKQAHAELATHSEFASAYMMQEVQGFNEHLERIAEVAIVLVVGAMLPFIDLPASAAEFLLLFFLVVRPLSVWFGLIGAPISHDQRILISWFGIRGIGSIYYLMYAINQGLPRPLAEKIIALTLTTVAVSIVLHGISVTPLMNLYARRKAKHSSR
ncbi:cation:proton antiporter [Candidatus Contendibacter odensensis]|uniref:Na+/H+ antiporter n=1 Tax=Candidatus Contendobacter odensis Run_B_J11 TaxID=1400861 RepID=A0A7U7G9M2_9GAMM|nr:cation:proton antiporter [Candidatus Contendobacter odensis]CDH44410.1 Na+/H+ antiporter [Candidatus Contendobacter odensis Run_B_J11]